jgi:hypothetical protein
MQRPKDCASLLFNFFCLETQREKNKARFEKMNIHILKVYFGSEYINNHKTSGELLAKI